MILGRRIRLCWAWVGLLLAYGCASPSDDEDQSLPAYDSGACNVVYSGVQSFCYEYSGFSPLYLSEDLRSRCLAMPGDKPLDQLATTWAYTTCKPAGKAVGCRLQNTETAAEASGQLVIWYYDATTWSAAIDGCPQERRLAP